MLFLSPCMSFLTHTRWLAFICNHCSLQNTGKSVIMITAILPMGKLRAGKVKWLTQRHTENWWQHQDSQVGILRGSLLLRRLSKRAPWLCSLSSTCHVLLLFHYAKDSLRTRDMPIITEGWNNDISSIFSFSFKMHYFDNLEVGGKWRSHSSFLHGTTEWNKWRIQQRTQSFPLADGKCTPVRRILRHSPLLTYA